MDNIFVYIVDLPVNEMVVPCLDGYTVYIDVKLSYAEQIESYRHAMSHIINDDWSLDNADDIERIRHASA